MTFIRAQNSQVQQMLQVSCCMITVVILEQEHFQSFPNTGSEMLYCTGRSVSSSNIVYNIFIKLTTEGSSLP